MEQMESTELVADFVTTAGAMGTDDEDDDERKSENGKVKTIHPLRAPRSSHLSQGDSQYGVGTSRL